TNAAFFAAFQLPNSGNLSLARFTTRFTLSPGESISVPARFADGLPFLTSAKLGAGRVVLVNSSIDTTWNDWPKHKTFVPWLHGTARFLAALDSRDPAPARLSLVAGADGDLELGPAAAKTTLKLQPPQGKE